MAQVPQIESLDQLPTMYLAQSTLDDYILPFTTSGDIIHEKFAPKFVEGRLVFMDFLLVARLRIQYLELFPIGGQRKHDHIFLVMLVLDGVHHDKVVVVEVQQTDGLGDFETENELGAAA